MHVRLSTNITVDGFFRSLYTKTVTLPICPSIGDRVDGQKVTGRLFCTTEPNDLVVLQMEDIDVADHDQAGAWSNKLLRAHWGMVVGSVTDEDTRRSEEVHAMCTDRGTCP